MVVLGFDRLEDGGGAAEDGESGHDLRRGIDGAEQGIRQSPAGTFLFDLVEIHANLNVHLLGPRTRSDGFYRCLVDRPVAFRLPKFCFWRLDFWSPDLFYRTISHAEAELCLILASPICSFPLRS